MLEAVLRRVLQAAFGGGSDIGAANPLPVTSGDALEHGVASDGTNTTLEDTTKDWGINMWEDAILAVEIGGIEYHRHIVSNTDDTITIDALPALIVPVAGDPYTIRRVVTPGEVHIDPYTGVGNITPAAVFSTAVGSFKAVKVQIHWGAATSNPVTITLDANAGADYDTVLHVQTMGAGTDMIYYFPA
ncbi:unnamed protein product, partial [marine sediment metagenome]